MMKRAMSALIAGMAIGMSIPAPAAAEVGGARIVVEYAEKAIAKGYGSMCSLAMLPVKTGGYYHCVDFGPYRYVKGYETVSAYVVQQGKAPYQVMAGPATDPVFVIGGPWMQDMPLRVISFWNDVVDGGADRIRATNEAAGRKKAAEEYINSLVQKERPTVVEVAGEKKDDTVVTDVLEDRIGDPVPPADLKKVLESVGQ